MNTIKVAKLLEYFYIFSRKRHATFEIQVNTWYQNMVTENPLPAHSIPEAGLRKHGAEP